MSELRRIVVTDCGSTTTKALLFELQADGWRQTARGEAPTTVEEPVADVTVGAQNAFSELEELRGVALLNPDAKENEKPFLKRTNNGQEDPGVDMYLSTSSAGGGLQMICSGIVKELSLQSAQRAALGAGAIVLDSISADDGRADYERIRRIRHLRPDIVLMAGGVDGGARSKSIEMAELFLAAEPKPRFGDTLKLPVIYAGNRDCAKEIVEILGESAQVEVVQNIRPTLDQEDIIPAREAIHEFFLSHVMSHSPGFAKLMDWADKPIVPTPAAVGEVVEMYARESGQQVLCADIGGATTDVFSVFRDRSNQAVFNRTVSANYGMSYSIANVMVEAGIENIQRWLPFSISQQSLRDQLRNKMIRPTSIPEKVEELLLEQAVCREALRLSLEHHKSLATGFRQSGQRGGISDIFSQKSARYQLVDLGKLDLVIGSGGVLSHAPDRLQALLMMLEGFGLSGVTQVAVDSIFMMPHLGALARVSPQAAHQIFYKDCLVNIGHTIVPLYRKSSGALARILIDGAALTDVSAGEVRRVALNAGQRIKLRVEPIRSEVDLGLGAGEVFEREIEIGPAGLVLDGRNRPLKFSSDEQDRISQRKRTLQALGI